MVVTVRNFGLSCELTRVANPVEKKIIIARIFKFVFIILVVSELIDWIAIKVNIRSIHMRDLTCI